MKVRKRDGALEPLDLDKIHAVLTWACQGGDDMGLPAIRGVSVSAVEMNAKLHFREGITTREIHEILIKSAADLISVDYPNYDRVAARLVWFAVRKEAFGSANPPHLRDIIARNIERGVYTTDITTLYSDEELDIINSMIDHSRDDLFRYAGAEQMRKKYLVQNRKTKALYESFQIPYILVAALLFAQYPADRRMSYIRQYYDLISQHYISLPTPIMAGLRTSVKQFSSCTLIDSGDSLRSITSSATAIVDYASRKAGIGLNIGRLRAEGQPVRGGDAVTTGVLPFAKFFNGALKSCSQGGVRGASATFNWPVWHLEFEKLIELKNNRGTDETRLRTVDYCIHLNEVFYRRLAENRDITFFSPEEVPDLYDAFYSSDIHLFENLYTRYERDRTKTRKTLPAATVLAKIMQERFDTGRIYIMNADHSNRQTPFYEPITMTNLCVEIQLPTEPVVDDDGLIALCTLSAINWGKFTNNAATGDQDATLKKACEMAVRGLDALLDYQDYPHPAAKRHTERYRPLGIGIIGFAHWLAASKLQWGEDAAVDMVGKMMEKMSYYMIDASVTLAEEMGKLQIPTRYQDGIFPHELSRLPARQLDKDWEALRQRVRRHGIRNAVLMAAMPSETSSLLSNETNGIEPPRSLFTVKGNKDSQMPQMVPEYQKLHPYYETAWDVSTERYLKTVAELQRFMDQSMSVNTYYDGSRNQLKMSHLLGDMLTAWKLGIKTLYYLNTRDGAGVDVEADDCESGACKI